MDSDPATNPFRDGDEQGCQAPFNRQSIYVLAVESEYPDVTL